MRGLGITWSAVCIVWSIYLTVKVAEFVHAWPF